MLGALSFAASQLVTVVLLMLIFFVIFGSFGIELFKGSLSHTCAGEILARLQQLGPRFY